jgi:hypothetical protein
MIYFLSKIPSSCEGSYEDQSLFVSIFVYLCNSYIIMYEKRQYCDPIMDLAEYLYK